MKSLSLKTGLIAGVMAVTALGTSAAFAQNQSSSAKSSDSMTALCRVKAKESANLAFRSCMSESKTSEVESIRRDYQEKLAAIKAEYEKELGRVSGKNDKQEIKPAVEEKSMDQESSDSESDLMKNAILEDFSDEIKPRDTLIRKASQPEAASKFKQPETASRSQLDKREPKEPIQVPRTKRSKTSYKTQIASQNALATKKAILFNDGMELPEPIPIEASFEARHQ